LNGELFAKVIDGIVDLSFPQRRQYRPHKRFRICHSNLGSNHHLSLQKAATNRLSVVC